jgi:DNA-binding transcriptional regulator YhcF (GntR family)
MFEEAGPHVVPFRDASGRTRRMILRLDPRSHIPPYEQLRAQLAVMVTVGHLDPGTRLPTVRELAEAVDLAAYSRTYRELENNRIIQETTDGAPSWSTTPESEPVSTTAPSTSRGTFAFAATARRAPETAIRPSASVRVACRARVVVGMMQAMAASTNAPTPAFRDATVTPLLFFDLVFVLRSRCRADGPRTDVGRRQRA